MQDVHTDSPWKIGVRSAGALIVPAVVLLAFGTALVTAYHRVPAVTEALTRFAEFRREMGPAFAPVSTAIAGGVVPWLFSMSLPALRPQRPGAELLFGLGWWAFMGWVIGAFYTGLGRVFDDTGLPFVAVVVAKVVCDMALFTPFFASPANALAHLWKAGGFDLRTLVSHLHRDWYRRLVLPNLIPNQVLWIPGVTLVYSLPVDLQLPMSNLIGCFWAMMCARIAVNSRPRLVD